MINAVNRLALFLMTKIIKGNPSLYWYNYVKNRSVSMQNEKKEELIFEGNKIEVIENKELFLTRLGITEDIISNKSVNTIIFMGIAKNEEELGNIKFTLAVYDYELFKEDSEIKKALLHHEFAHIHFPSTEGDVETEIKCDIFASNYVGLKAMSDALNLAIQEISKLSLPLHDFLIRKGEIDQLYKIHTKQN